MSVDHVESGIFELAGFLFANEDPGQVRVELDRYDVPSLFRFLARLYHLGLRHREGLGPRAPLPVHPGPEACAFVTTRMRTAMSWEPVVTDTDVTPSGRRYDFQTADVIDRCRLVDRHDGTTLRFRFVYG